MDLFRDLLRIDTRVAFGTKDLIAILVAVPLAYGLSLFINRTRLGKAMRATAQDREAASMMGIDINTTIMLTFLVGGALAGAAGAMYGLYNNSAWAFQGFRNGLYAFTAAVMGGIGNVNGALLGGVLIGVVAAFSDFLIDPRWTQAVVFGLLILVLVFRPTGLLGEETPERA
jgi:branched-chain amino acid transport system permease protein